jgi:hypothetical protein
VHVIAEVPHGRQEQRDAGLVAPDAGGFAGRFDHQHAVEGRIETVKHGIAWPQLVAKDQHQMAHRRLHALRFAAARQRSEQNLTSAQLRSHFFRQVMARPHTAQGFWGSAALLPLNPF